MSNDDFDDFYSKKSVIPLPFSWVSKIFAELSSIYGDQFLKRWDGTGLSIAEAKADWGIRLAELQKHPKTIRWALDNLTPGKMPPTVIDFLDAARKSPAHMREEEKKGNDAYTPANPDLVAVEIKRLENKLLGARNACGTDWIYRGIERIKIGDKISPAVKKIILDGAKAKHIDISEVI
jgi:hypothetical protein